MIRLAKASEIEKILTITRACAVHMESQGIYQWNEHYPSVAAFENDLAREELYVFMVAQQVAGCITISTHKDLEYESVSWLTPDVNQYYIHRLAVHPALQGKGYAQNLMDYAEDKAINEEVVSIRLDTFSKNKRNQQFYEQRGYKRLGSIYFPKQSEHPFYCYELVLNS